MPSTSFGSDALLWEDNKGPHGHDSLGPREQHVPVTDSPSSYNELHWTGGRNRESYAPAGPASSASSWTNTASFNSPFTAHGGGPWPDDWHPDEALFWLQFSTPGGNTDGLRANLTRMVAATPTLDQSIPLQGALSAPQPCLPPPSNWIQAPGASWQASIWNHPVSTARRYGHSSPIGSLDGRFPVSRFPPAAFPEVTGRSGRSVLPTGHLPSMDPHSAQPSTHGNPVPVAPSTFQPQTERSDLSLNANTFQCLWMSGVTRCRALVTGDRRSITSHLRDEHAFTCDGVTIACAWGQCMALPMQRRNIPRHIVACHLEIRVKCSECDMTLSRADAKKKHRLACPRTKMPVVVDAGEGDHGRLFF